MLTVNEDQILAALHRLEPSRWEEVLDFIGYLYLRTASAADEPLSVKESTMTARDLAASDVVGIWEDRTDIEDVSRFARHLREQAEHRHGA